MVDGAPARNPADGPWRWWFGGTLRFLAFGAETGEAFCACVFRDPPGGGAPPHVHARELECFYVLSGGPVTFRAGDTRLTLGPGGCLAIAPGTAHQFRVEGNETAHLLVICTPAGFDRFLMAASDRLADPDAPRTPQAADRARLDAAAPRHGITLHPGPSAFAQPPDIALARCGDGIVRENAGGTLRTLVTASATANRLAVSEIRVHGGGDWTAAGRLTAPLAVYAARGTLALRSGAASRTLAPGAFTLLPAGEAPAVRGARGGTATALVWQAPAAAETALPA